jgi:hypothetical protein
MSQADEALVVIHQGDSGFARLRYHRVTIDGRLAGYTARLRPTTELSVDPGVHTVKVSMDWVHSQPLRLELAPGSRTDVRITDRPGVRGRLRSGAPKVLAFLTVSPLVLLDVFGVHRWWLQGPFLLVGTFCLWGAYNWIASLLVKDYWALRILEPMSGAVAKSPSPAAE